MDLAQRLNHLETVRDWQGFAEELEKGIASENDAATKASYHLRLGRVLEDKFLHAVRALKHFQDAYKLNPALAGALRHARAIYWNLGKINMVQKLLELELKSSSEPAATTELLLELGDVLSDIGDHEKATAAYARALSVSGGASEEARSCLTDIQVDESTWRAHVAGIVEQSSAAPTPEARARLYMRAARIAKRFAAGEVEGLLAQAYEADPGDKQAAALFEQTLVDADRAQGIVDTQRRVLDNLAGASRGGTAFRYGVRWATRHQNPELGAQLFEEALSYDPDSEGAFVYLRDLWGTKQGEWERVAKLAETVADSNGSSPFMVAQAGLVLWRNVGNLMRARTWFERLAALAPDHPTLLAFEAQIGEKLGSGDAKAAPIGAPAHETHVEASSAAAAPRAAPAPSVAPVAPPPEPEPYAEAAPAHIEAPTPPTPAPAAVAPAAVAAAPAAPPESVKPAVNIDELLAKAAKQEQAKRYNEYVKTLIELAEGVVEPSDFFFYYS